MSITQALLNQISGADEDRALRAIEALSSGAMVVSILHNASVLTAEVISRVIVGKKKPVEKMAMYNVMIAPDHSECTCPDWQYRGTICKHIIGAGIVGQEELAAHQQAA